MSYKLQSLLTALLVANANHKWILSSPITVRLSDADFDLLEIQGLQVTENNELYIMVFEDEYGYDREVWMKLESACENTELVVERLHERVVNVYKQEVVK